MICISVTPESRQLAKVDILNASRQCDLIEVCLDRLIKEPDVKEMLEGAKKPVLVSCRRAADGGQFQGTEDERQGLLRQAILAGPAYVELDLEIARRIPRFGKTQRVISYTSLGRPLGNVDEVFDEAVSAQADVIKFTWPTETLEAAWPLLAAVSQKRAIPIVGLGLGRCGLSFSLLGRKYGSPWIYAALEKGMEAFPGQPTVGELDDIYRWREVGPKTRFIGLAGFGEAEVMTAKVFNAGFDALKLNTRCLPFDVRSLDQLPKMLEILKIPAVIATGETGRKLAGLAVQRDEVATQANFTDLLVKQADGWHGHNLIWKTALRALEERLGKTTSGERPLDRRNAIIVGGGGLAHSIALGIQKRSGMVSVCAGDEQEGQAIARQTGTRFVPPAQLYDTLFDVVVLTTGSLDHASRRQPVNPSLLRPDMTVLDLIQFPADSPLTSEARDRSCRLIEPSAVFADYLGDLFKSLSGQELPVEAFAKGLAE